MERTDAARAVLYFASHAMTPETMARIRAVKAAAKAAGIARRELVEVDLSSNLKLRARIAQEAGERTRGFPYVRLDGRLLADDADVVVELARSKGEPGPIDAMNTLTRRVSEDYLSSKDGEDEDEEDDDPAKVYANIFESVRLAREEDTRQISEELSKELERSKIEVYEAAVQRAGSNTTLSNSPGRPMTEDDLNLLGRASSLLEGAVRGVLTWWYGEQSVSPTKAKLSRMNNDKTINFIVLQTNWYWRQQIRHLRIDQVALARIHPLTQQVKEVHGLGDIAQVAISGNTFVTLFFSDGSRPEYYESRDRDHLVFVLCVRARALTGYSLPIVTIRGTD